MERLHKTGLVIPDYVPWGTHLCQFYETKDDLLEILVPFFKEGLASNELCLWITSTPITVEQARDALRTVVPDLDCRLSSGQMEIIPHDEWYLIDGCFDIDRVLGSCCRKAGHALRRGFDGLRITGSSACLQDDRWAELLVYEQKVQSAIARHRIIALCSYPLQECTALQFLQAVDSHDCAVLRRQGGWDCIEGKGSKKLLDRRFAQKHALASSISPLIMTDLRGRLTYANAAALKAWGYETESEVLERHATDFWHDSVRLAACLEKVRTQGSCVDELTATRRTARPLRPSSWGV